ncbi:MAG: DUF58 domain-containing protein [bacterium]|nr:DUF58 domain-containing protein [bacterium]
MLQRFLDPQILAGISGLDLVAKTVVDGFVAGLHRSPDFGFSQEFAEYQAYTPGDDLRHVDWNVFARTERCYLKRYHGETNSQLTLLLDVSSSMNYGSGAITKVNYARFLAASLFHLASKQRDAAGLIVFDADVRNYVKPSTRQGQLHRLLHAIELAEPAEGVLEDFAKPFVHFQEFLRRRGLVVVITDFRRVTPAEAIRTIEPLTFRGNEVIVFHVVDPVEVRPTFEDPVTLIDMETGDSMEVSPEFVRNVYPERMKAHIEELRTKAQNSGMDYFLLETNRPLDAALREYLSIRQGRM